MPSDRSANAWPSYCVVNAEPRTDGFDWVALDRLGDVMDFGHGAPAEWMLQSGTEVIALMKASLCTPMMLDLPVMPKRQAAQALRWAAEEFVAGPIEDEHVVAGPRKSAGHLSALTIRQEKMQALTASLAPWQPDRLVPDALCLPHQPGQLSMARHQDRLLLRWDDWAFGSYPESVALTMLASFAELTWVWFGRATPPVEISDRVQRMNSETEELHLLAQWSIQVPVNVLTGPFEPSSANQSRAQWLKVVGALAACGALALMFVGLETRLLANEADRLRSEVASLYQSMFPDQPAMGRERELAERELAQLQYGQAAGLLDLMVRVGPILASQPAVSVESLSFRDGQLRLDLKASEIASLDELEGALNRTTLIASLRSATLSLDGARGQMDIGQGAR